MPFNLSTLTPDPAKMRDGVVFALGADAGIRLRPMFGPNYERARSFVYKRFGNRPSADLRLRLLAYAVLIDWSGLTYTNDSGAEVPVPAYSPAIGYEALKRIPALAYEIEQHAEDWRNYR